MSAPTSRAIPRAIASGAVLSAPLFMTPWASRVPVGSRTVWIRAGTSSRNSIQFRSFISRVVGCAIAPHAHTISTIASRMRALYATPGSVGFLEALVPVGGEVSHRRLGLHALEMLEDAGPIA